MKEIYIHDREMPKNCDRCPFYYYDTLGVNGYVKMCRLSDEPTSDNVRAKHCPLCSLEQHDSKVREKAIQEFAEKIKTRIEPV